MKKLLVISYHYPPGKEVSGRRVQQLVEHLPSFGWDYRILTIRRGTEDKKVHESRFLEITSRKPWIQRLTASSLGKGQRWRNIARMLKRAVFIPDEKIGWLPFAYKEACHIIRKEQIDAVLISCGPFSTSLLAPLLKKKMNVPVIMDFQDAWTLNPYAPSRLSSKYLERWVLRYADHLLTTTPTTTRLYKKQYPWLPVETIYVGFKEALFRMSSDAPAKRSKKVFTITYAGTLDRFRRMDLFLQAVNNMPFKDIRVEIYGELYQSSLLDHLKQQGMRNVRYHGFTDEQKLLRVVQKTDLLLLLQSFALYKKPCLPIAGKTFTYIRTGIPILYIGPEGDNAKFIRKYTRTSSIITKPSVPKIRKSIINIHDKSKKSKARKCVNQSFIEKFNTCAITKSFVDVLNKLYEKSR